MDLQKAQQAKTLLDEINKQERELKSFEPSHKNFRIYFSSDIPDERGGGIFKSDLHTSLDQNEYNYVIQFIENLIINKIDKLKKQLNEL